MFPRPTEEPLYIWTKATAHYIKRRKNATAQKERRWLLCARKSGGQLRSFSPPKKKPEEFLSLSAVRKKD
jgi:hypothetical protein